MNQLYSNKGVYIKKETLILGENLDMQKGKKSCKNYVDIFNGYRVDKILTIKFQILKYIFVFEFKGANTA